MKERKRVWDRKRPIAVTVVAWGIVILFLLRLYEVYRPLSRMGVLEHGLGGPLTAGMWITPLGIAIAISAGYLLQVMAGMVVLIGFLQLRRWAWVLMMAWTGASLLITLINYFYSRPNYLIMASDVIIAVALSQSDVQRIFRVRTDQNESPV